MRKDYPVGDYSTDKAAAAKSLQSCPTLCNPIGGSPPGSPVPGILQQEHWSGFPLPSPLHRVLWVSKNRKQREREGKQDE